MSCSELTFLQLYYFRQEGFFMSLINISNLTFAYPGSYDNIFENASFQLDTDWKLGFIGRNGRGKTTLLNLLMGKYEYSGSISASVSFEYFPYQVRDSSLDTVSVVHEILPDIQMWQLMREMHLLQLDDELLYRPFCTLSNGEQVKLLLAALFLKENGFLLIDEPTNHLDLAARKLVGQYLNSKKGFILVSHDRAFLDGCVDHILSINKAAIEVQRGNFSTWQQNKELQDSFELAENEKLEREVNRLKSAARQTSAWSDRVEKTKKGSKNSGLRPDTGYIGHKAAKMMSRSKSIEKRRQSAIEQKEKLLKNIEFSQPLKIHPLQHYSQILLRFENVGISYRPVCRPVSFTLSQGEFVSIAGKNGAGKSSLLKLACGYDIPHSGKIISAAGLKISYLAQDTGALKGGLSEFAAQRNIDETLFKTILRKLDFSREQFEKDMCDFSAGQKKKALLAASLCEQAHIYIWDEPLNYIDLISRMQIEQLLIKYRPTLLFVEHDSAFCQNIGARTVFL